MADIQIFQWLGIAFFAMGMGMLTHPKFLRDIMKDFTSSATNVFFGGLACLAIGFPLVSFHNVWALNSSLIITLLGWLSFLKGLALLMFPVQTMNVYKKVLKKENKSFVSFYILILGIILLYFGYFA